MLSITDRVIHQPQAPEPMTGTAVAPPGGTGASDDREATEPAALERRQGWGGAIRGLGEGVVNVALSPYYLYTSVRDHGVLETAGAMLEGMVNMPSMLCEAAQSGDVQTLVSTGVEMALGMKAPVGRLVSAAARPVVEAGARSTAALQRTTGLSNTARFGHTAFKLPPASRQVPQWLTEEVRNNTVSAPGPTASVPPPIDAARTPPRATPHEPGGSSPVIEPGPRRGLSNTARFGHTSFDLPPTPNQVPGSPVLLLTNREALHLPKDPASAPRRLDFLAPFQRPLDEAWRKTKSTNNEHGFLFSIEESQIRVVNAVSGGESWVKLNLELPLGQERIGTAHTHPADTPPGKSPRFYSFSEIDIGSFLAGKHPVELLLTGSTRHPQLGKQYLCLRTEATKRPAGGPELFFAEWHAFEARLKKDLGLANTLHLTNAWMAAKNGYVYYEGHGGRFRKVDFF